MHARDLVREFRYSPATARSYLSYLGRQDLLQRLGLNHGLTGKGEERLRYFDVAGCAHPACPLCQRQAGSYQCPRCGYQLATRKARLLPERDFLLAIRHAGVYCPRCLKLLFPEAQALLLGIPREHWMNQVGWEIRPLGWLLLILVGMLLVYLLFRKFQRPPAEARARTVTDS